MRFDFSSFADLCAFAAVKPAAIGKHPMPFHAFMEGEGARKFCETASMDEAQNLARDGWEAGRSEVEKKRAHFGALIGAKALRAVNAYEVAGYTPDVPEFLSGNPECMIVRKYEETEGAGRILRLVFNCAASHAMSQQTIIARGAIACALVDAIESTGARVEIVLCAASSRSGFSCSFFATIKQASEPVEMDKLAFALAHPSTLRRIGLSVFEHDAPFIARNYETHGTPQDVDEVDRGDVYIGRASLEDTSDRAAVSWAREQLAKVGITFEDHS